MWCHLPEPVFGPLRQWVLIAPVSTSGIPRLVLAEVEGELTAHKTWIPTATARLSHWTDGSPVPLDSGDGLAASFEVAPPHRPVPSVQEEQLSLSLVRGVTGHWTPPRTLPQLVHYSGRIRGAEKRMKCCCCCENSPLSCDEIVDGSIAMSDGQRGVGPHLEAVTGNSSHSGLDEEEKEGKRGRDEGEGCFLEGGGRRGRGAGGYRLLLLASPFVTPPAVEFC